MSGLQTSAKPRHHAPHRRSRAIHAAIRGRCCFNESHSRNGRGLIASLFIATCMLLLDTLKPADDRGRIG